MTAQVYTFLITYEGLEDKIWRKTQVSSNCWLNQLGYMVLATFDTLAYHLFELEYADRCFQIPDEDNELDDGADMLCFQLYQLKMKPGDKLKMTYDFGCNQVFWLELLSAEPMGRGQGMRYPRLTEGAGCGILDDIPADETKALVEQIDQNGCTDEPIYYNESSYPWDYRHFDLESANRFLKVRMEMIQEGYEAGWDDYEE